MTQSKAKKRIETEAREARIAWHKSDEGKRVARAIIDELAGDGHSIYEEALLTEAGMPKQHSSAYAREHKSDGTPKGSITRGGALVPSMCGVYSLSFYRAMCAIYGVDSETDFMGCGSEARELHRRLCEWFDANGAPSAKKEVDRDEA